MGALILAETNRFVSRRMTRYFPLAMAGLMIVGIVIAIVVVNVEDIGGVNFVDDIVGLDDDGSGTDVLGPMGVLIPIMAFVIGASYFGADEKVGMIEQLLTWEPRRWRLLIARAIGGGVSMFVIASLLSMFLVALLFVLSVVTGGDTSGVGDVVGPVLGSVARSGIAGAIFLLMGLGFTAVANNSTVTIVGFALWVFVIESTLLSGILPRWTQWFPVSNVISFVSGRDFEFFPGPFDEAESFEPIILYGSAMAGFRVLVWGLLAIGIGIFIFQRRDID